MNFSRGTLRNIVLPDELTSQLPIRLGDVKLSFGI